MDCLSRDVLFFCLMIFIGNYLLLHQLTFEVLMAGAQVFHMILHHLRCKYDRNYMVKVNENRQA